MQPPEPCDHKPRTDGWKRPGKTRPQPPPGLCGRHGPADLRFGPLVPQTLEPPERRFSRVSPSVCEASLWQPEGPYCPEENCHFSAHMLCPPPSTHSSLRPASSESTLSCCPLLRRPGPEHTGRPAPHSHPPPLCVGWGAPSRWKDGPGRAPASPPLRLPPLTQPPCTCLLCFPYFVP